LLGVHGKNQLKKKCGSHFFETAGKGAFCAFVLAVVSLATLAHSDFLPLDFGTPVRDRPKGLSFAIVLRTLSDLNAEFIDYPMITF
jgi:hypothetical protein